VTILRNGAFSECLSPFNGNQIESRVTDDHNDVYDCGTSRGHAGDQTVDPGFAGPASVPIPTVDFAHGRRLWDWAGEYQPIIDQFDTTNPAMVDSGLGSEPPCAGAACDIGVNEFF